MLLYCFNHLPERGAGFVLVATTVSRFMAYVVKLTVHDSMLPLVPDQFSSEGQPQPITSYSVVVAILLAHKIWSRLA